MKLRLLSVAIAAAVVASGCGSDEAPSEASINGTTITVLTHDSFVVSDEVLASFTAQSGVTVELLSSGDAGSMVSHAIVTAGNPLGDVMFGIDNTFLQRGLDADLFEPYEANGLDTVAPGLDIDPKHRVTPIDFGDVCINYWVDAAPDFTPTTLEDLTNPILADQLVVQSPESSSPGLAFLLATIAGTDDWEQYWRDLVANGVSVTSGWEDAYYGEFTAGGGDRSYVVSYASSPAAEVIFADPPVDVAPTQVLLDSCFRQIEFAGVLRGTESSQAAQAFIDFMLTPTFQEDIPANMFVFPAVADTTLPPEFVEFAQLAENPHILDPAEIEANRNVWVDRWVDIIYP